MSVLNGDDLDNDLREPTVDRIHDPVLGTFTINGFGGNDLLSASNSLAGANLLYGGDGADTLFGSTVEVVVIVGTQAPRINVNGPDTLDGGSGNDVIYPHGGNDTVIGGEGFDILIYGDAVQYYFDSANRSFSKRDDLVIVDNSSIRVDLAAGTAKSSPVPLIQTSWNGLQVAKFENAFAFTDTISGIEEVRTGSGDDVLAGSDGAVERFSGGKGSDIINGRDGYDIVSYIYEAIDPEGMNGVKVNLAKGIAKTDFGQDRIRNIEAVEGTIGDDVIIGDDNYNALEGHAGNDTLDGAGGEDLLDYLAQSLFPTWAGTAPAGVYVDVKDEEATDPNGFTDTIRNLERIRGGIYDDELYGDNGYNYFLGADGDDIMDARGGDDKLWGDNGNDTIDGGKGNDSLYGGEGDDTLVGGKGRDRLDGGDGANTLTGGKGKDEFIFNGIPVEVDTITDFQFGTDKIKKTSPASAGTFPDAGVPAGISLPPTALLLDALGKKDMVVKIGESPLFKLGGGIQDFNKFLKKSVLKIDKAIVGTDGIDDLRGTSKADFIYGLGGIDRLSGGKGNDFLSGGDLYDDLFGGKGNDTLLGGDGRDTLNGNDGDNRLYGGEDYDILVTSTGDDILDGGPEFDRMSGGPGKDIFVVSDNTGYPIGRADLIQDFELGVDKIDLSGLFIGGRHLVESDLSFANPRSGRAIVSVNGPFGSTEIAEINFSAKDFDKIGERAFLKSNPFIFTGGPASIVGSDGGDTSTGTNGDDVFFGGRGFDTLRGKNGNDILDGGDAKDTLVGGQGADQLFGGAGNDQLDGGADDDILQGDSGNDSLTGGTGKDYLFGGSGGDTLIGGDGDDFLSGGAGKDILTGGDGADNFHFVDVSDRFTDVITDFELGVDRISIGESVKKNFKFEMTDSFLKLFSDDAQSKPFLKLDLGEGLHKLLTDAELF